LTARKVVLVIDDDEQLTQGIQDYLEAQGYVVYTANDGIQAYPLASARNPSLIILDVDMPITNGFKALERLRAEPGTKNIPVILMTGVASADVIPAIKNMPLLSHVKKPIPPEDLLSLVRHYIPESV
jgi:CheY-like chemotaxis protein